MKYLIAWIVITGIFLVFNYGVHMSDNDGED